MSTLQTYYFEKQVSGEWHVHDQHGSGDMVLEKDDVNTFVTPTLVRTLGTPAILGDTTIHYQHKLVNLHGFDTLQALVVLYVKDGFIYRADLCGVSTSKVIIRDLKRFTLTIPYFVGKRIPDECD